MKCTGLIFLLLLFSMTTVAGMVEDFSDGWKFWSATSPSRVIVKLPHDAMQTEIRSVCKFFAIFAADLWTKSKMVMAYAYRDVGFQTLFEQPKVASMDYFIYFSDYLYREYSRNATDMSPTEYQNI